MPSLLVTVFVIQLILHIINTAGASTINELLWNLYNELPTPTSKSAHDAQKLKREVVRLKREMANTSAQDDFAKWAKLRRQHDKAVADYEKIANTLQSSKASFDTRITILRTVAVNGTRLFLQYWYRKAALFWIPGGWVPYYVEWLLSFPKAPLGSVSIQVWGMACAGVISMASEAVIAAFLLAIGRTIEKRPKAAAPQKAQ